MAQSQDAIQGSRPVQRLAGLAAEINQGGVDTAPQAAPEFRQDKAAPFPAQLKDDAGPRPNRTGLPDQLKAGVESLSGVSLDNVRVHYNSAQPAQLNALAYAQGTDIHVAPGQEQHLPHEAWHVVQQAQGRVRPTMQMKSGVSVNDDAGLEHEADAMGAKALSEGPSPAAPEAGATSAVSDDHAPVQRLIGFEVEYQVPTFGPSSVAVKLQGGAKAANSNVQKFLFGGLTYGSKLGGSADPGANSFRITSDHNSALSTEPIRAKLAAMGKLDPADSQDPDHHSNLEYVTSPVDELARGADKTLGTLIDKVSKHATDTLALATQETASMVPAPATNAATGTPVDKIQDWLSPEDFLLVKPTIDKFRENIVDSCYLQATVGILPTAISKLFSKAAEEDGLHTTGDQFTQIYAAVTNVTSAVRDKVKDEKYYKEKRATQALASVGEMIRLLGMYLIGEALSQTEAFPGGTIKNAVPFLIKVDPSKIADAGPYGMLFDEVTDDFVAAVAAALSEREEITVAYWRDKLGYAARARKDTDFVTNGSIQNLTKMFLQGKKPAATQAQTGSQLAKVDAMPEITKGGGDKTEDQSGIPLEYRYIKARPSAAGLKAELMKLVAEAREINLSRVSEERKAAIEKQVKE